MVTRGRCDVEGLAEVVREHGQSAATAVRDPDQLVEFLTPITRPHRVRPQVRGARLDAHVDSVLSMNVGYVSLAYGADVEVIPSDVDPETHLFPINSSGSATLTYGNDSVLISRPSATIIAPYRPFRSLIRSDYRQVILAIRRQRIEAMAAQLLGADSPVPVEVPLVNFDLPPVIKVLLETNIRLASDVSGAVSPSMLAKMDDLVIEAVLLAVPGFRQLLPEPADVRSNRLRSAMAYMDGHLAEPVTVSEVARHVGVTPRSLQLSFRREVGTTPIGWLRDRRLEHARALLVDPDPPTVSEAARSSGFHHLGDFAAAFKSRFGESPSAVRRRMIVPGN